MKLRWRLRASGLPMQIWVLTGAASINYLGYMVIPFFTLYLTSVAGVSLVMSGVLLTLHGLASIAGTWIGGRLSDRFRSEAVLVVSLMMSAGVMTAFPFFSDTSQLIVAVSVLALAQGAFRPAYDTSVVKYCPGDQRAKAYATYVIAINVGAGCAAFIAGRILEIAPDVLFYIDGATSMIAAAAIVLLLPSSKRPKAATRKRSVGDPHASRPPFRNAVLFIASVSAFLADAVARQLSVTLPIYAVEDLGLTPEGFGTVVSTGYLVFAFAVLPVSQFVNRRTERAFSTTGMFLLGMAFIGFSVAANVYALVALYLVAAAGQLLFYPAIMAVVMGEAANNGGREGSYLGFYRTVQAVAGPLAPAAGTFVYKQTGPSSLWILCGTSSIAAALLLAAMPGSDRSMGAHEERDD